MGIAGTGSEIAKTIINKRVSIPASIINEYRQYLKTIVSLETGMNGKFKDQPQGSYISKRRHSPQSDSLPILKRVLHPEEQKTPSYPLYLDTGKNPRYIPIGCLESFKEQMANVNFGNIPPEDVWLKLQKLSTLTPKEISLHYRDKVAGGHYHNWTEIHIGTTVKRIIFKIDSEQQGILFKIGDHETIYESKRRRKGKDKSRSL